MLDLFKRYKLYWVNKLSVDSVYTLFYSSDIFNYLLRSLISSVPLFTFTSNILQFIGNILAYSLNSILSNKGISLINYYTHNLRKYVFIPYITVLILYFDSHLLIPIPLKLFCYSIFIVYFLCTINIGILVNFILLREVSEPTELSNLVLNKNIVGNLFSLLLSLVTVLLTSYLPSNISILLVILLISFILHLERHYFLLLQPTGISKNSVISEIPSVIYHDILKNKLYSTLSVNARKLFIANNLQNVTFVSVSLEFAYFYNLYNITASDLFIILLLKQLSMLLCSVLLKHLPVFDSRILMGFSRVFLSLLKYGLMLFFIDKSVIYLSSISDGISLSVVNLGKERSLIDYLSVEESKKLNSLMRAYQSLFGLIGTLFLLPFISLLDYWVIFSIIMLFRISTLFVLRNLEKI